MNLIEQVKEIESKYHAGQNIFRRPSVGFLLERISQLEQAAQQKMHPTPPTSLTDIALARAEAILAKRRARKSAGG